MAAIGYWEKWTNLNFVIVQQENLIPIINMRKVPNPVLYTAPTPIPGITQAIIEIDQGFTWHSDDIQAKSLCHEMGHAIGISGHPPDGTIMDILVPHGKFPIFHPCQQKAFKIVYSMAPGSKI